MDTTEFSQAEVEQLNKLIGNIAKRAGELAMEPINNLRSRYPIDASTEWQTISYCKDSGLTKADLIQAILNEEFLIQGD